MIKRYKSSKLIRVFSFGFLRNGYTIENGFLRGIELFSKSIPISSIKTISFELHSSVESDTFYYIITDKNNKEYKHSYSTLDGETYQELFRDILSINPNILLTSEMQKILATEINQYQLKFNFSVYKGSFFKQNREFSQKYPSLGAFIGFSIVFLFFLINGIFWFLGNNLIVDFFGMDYNLYRICAIVISGLAFSVAISNVVIALFSMYLGHKLTIISLVISLVGLYIGFKP